MLHPMKTLLLLLALMGQRVPATTARLSGRIDFDGRPNEAAWSTLPLTHASHDSEVRVGYDDDYIYAAGWFHKRGTFLIYIDYKCYGLGADGEKLDPLVDEDGGEPDRNYDGTWWAASTSQGKDWFVELRIPGQFTEGTQVWIEFDDGSRYSLR